ncbi:MAG TPA: serine/threonine-protein kinase, partial [Jatrophihabitantaceae bacterium]
MDRVVAIKALDAPSAESRAQWRSEAQVLAALDDPHLVAVYGYAENAEGAYIIEEWVDGAPLTAVLSAGPLSAAQALGVIRGALLGLAHVHARGLVHGDIAPANILFDTAGSSKLVDFGLSSYAGATSASSGTTAYASPEAQRGQPVTAPSDVYAAAAVLAYLLRGRAAVTPVLDGVDAALRPVLRRALDADPARRYPDAAAFLAALEEDATRRYGATWWTQTGLAALVAAAPATVLIEGSGTAAVAGHG